MFRRKAFRRVVDVLEAVFEAGDLLPHLAHGQDDRSGVLALLLHPGNLLGGLVPLEPQVLDLFQDLFPFRGKLDQGREVERLPPRPEPFPDEFQVLQDEFRVQHAVQL